MLLNSWLDRDLGIAGRVLTRRRLVPRSSTCAACRTRSATRDPSRPRRERHRPKLDPQQHLHPVWGSGTSTPGEFAEWLADADRHRRTGLVGAVPLRRAGRGGAWRRCVAARQRPARQPGLVLGGHDVAGGIAGRGHRRDDRLATTTRRSGRRARPAPADRSSSTSSNGSSSPAAARATTSSVPSPISTCVSADNAHAVHPNYTERHEPGHRPLVNAGPAIKINANQRYATSADTAAVFQRACVAAGVPWQVFVSRNNMPCGSTIGPITATRLGIATVDVGVPAAVDALGARAVRRPRPGVARVRPRAPTSSRRRPARPDRARRGAGPRRTAAAARCGAGRSAP